MKLKTRLPEQKYWDSLIKRSWDIAQQYKNQKEYSSICDQFYTKTLTSKLSHFEFEDELLAISRVSKSLYYIKIYDELLGKLEVIADKQTIVRDIRKNFYQSEAINPDLYRYFKRDIRILFFQFTKGNSNFNQFLDLITFYKKIFQNKNMFNHMVEKLISLLSFKKHNHNSREIKQLIATLKELQWDVKKFNNKDIKFLNKAFIQANKNHHVLHNLFQYFKLASSYPLIKLTIAFLLLKNLSMIKGEDESNQKSLSLIRDESSHTLNLEVAMEINLNDNNDYRIIPVTDRNLELIMRHVEKDQYKEASDILSKVKTSFYKENEEVLEDLVKEIVITLAQQTISIPDWYHAETLAIQFCNGLLAINEDNVTAIQTLYAIHSARGDKKTARHYEERLKKLDVTENSKTKRINPETAIPSKPRTTAPLNNDLEKESKILQALDANTRYYDSKWVYYFPGAIILWEVGHQIIKRVSILTNLAATIKQKLHNLFFSPRKALLDTVQQAIRKNYAYVQSQEDNLEFEIKHTDKYPFKTFTCTRQNYVKLVVGLIASFDEVHNSGNPQNKITSQHMGARVDLSLLTNEHLEKLIIFLNDKERKYKFDEELLQLSSEFHDYQKKIKKDNRNNDYFLQLLSLFQQYNKTDFKTIETKLTTILSNANSYINDNNKKTVKIAKEIKSLVELCQSYITKINSFITKQELNNNNNAIQKNSIEDKISNIKKKLNSNLNDERDALENELSELKKTLDSFQDHIVNLNKCLEKLTAKEIELKNLTSRDHKLNIKNDKPVVLKTNDKVLQKLRATEELEQTKKLALEHKVLFHQEKEKRKLAKLAEEKRQMLEKQQQEASEQQKLNENKYQKQRNDIKTDSRTKVAKDCLDIICSALKLQKESGNNNNSLKLADESSLIAACKKTEPEKWQLLLGEIVHYCLLYNIMKMMHALGQLVTIYPDHINFVESQTAYAIRDEIMHFANLSLENKSLLLKFSEELTSLLNNALDRLIKYGESHCDNIFSSLTINFKQIINSSRLLNHEEKLNNIIITAQYFDKFHRVGQLLKAKNFILLDHCSILLTAMRGCIFIIGSGLKKCKKDNIQLSKTIYQDFINKSPDNKELFNVHNKTKYEEYRKIIGHFFTNNYVGDLKINREQGPHCLFEELGSLQLENLAKNYIKVLIQFCNFVTEKINENNNNSGIKISKQEQNV